MQAQPPAPPPPVVIQKGQATAAFAAFPKIADGPNHFVVMGLNLTGDDKLVEVAKTKVAAAGWPSEYLTDRSGRRVLSVGAEHRTLQQVVGLARQLKNKDFGAVDAQVFTIPDPSFIR